ncbi:hypothetical protein GT347_20950 [Xylophilus rhododendri]|uniref:Uncharacterized protein n=1 Tax=Xylophilus rhododendri TaxID=2697032 RepID=A0A857J849_9BURK|nr:hypothetical protein [Xylophilus rhododendri]QHJ00231.1 hypothetical protein GT347_20950 [Xylophilus rhododendri]
MNPLQSELRRLYLLPPASEGEGDAAPRDAHRCLVLELARAPGWGVLSRVWQGVQAELELPAPAIAVSGTDGLQLWFSLVQPVGMARGHAFLEGLAARFLADVDVRRLRMFPSARDGMAPPPVPALQGDSGNWSAFIAPDLAPVFEETPWLDIPPGNEGQAALLRTMRSISRSNFEDAMALLAPAASSALAVQPGPLVTTDVPLPANDPRRFLQKVMDDESVDLALRIEAAKALLQTAASR